jgi:fructoselysine-6-P-deglycase FrlB-like protein
LVFAILPNDPDLLNAGYLTSLEFVEPGYLVNVTNILLRAGKTHLAAVVLWISIQIENVLAHGIGSDNHLADMVAMLSELKLGTPYYSSTPPKDVVQQQAAEERE